MRRTSVAPKSKPRFARLRNSSSGSPTSPTGEVCWRNDSEQLTAAEKELPGADHSRLEKAARKLRAKDAADIETRLDALRTKLDTLAKDETQKESDLSAAKALARGEAEGSG